jgi:branched-chain amino acid transport system ATP-binding protein
MTNAALHVTDLNVEIQGISALRHVSLQVLQGEMVGLLGRNGAGKTTFIRSVMGHIQPKSGGILLRGVDLLRMAPHTRAVQGIGYLPEDRGLISKLTVEENLLLPHFSGVLKDWQDRLAFVYGFIPELVSMKSQRGLQLSGGQQKLVALGRAMMTGTNLLLLDEPFEGVAPALSTRLAELIGEYKSTGCTILITQSNSNRADSLFDRVFTIERGEVAE